MTITLEDVPVAVVALDDRGAVVDINERAASLLELSSDMVAGRPVSDAIPCLSGVLEGGREELTVGGRAVRASVGPSTGGPASRIVVLTDVSDVVQRRESAEEVARARSDFLAKLSHEIRSALASMIGFAEMLKDGVSETNRELAGVITLSGRHLIETLNAVMDLARMEFGEENVELTDVDVVSRIIERVAVFSPAAERKGITLRFVSDAREIQARLNPVFLDRILHNLIDNAVKYTDEGQVEVDAEQREGQIWIYVADTGRGMKESFIPRLFSPFEREKVSGKREEGVGLGLAVTRYLVELMGGRIVACSTPGQGSTFTVSFPKPDRGAL